MRISKHEHDEQLHPGDGRRAIRLLLGWRRLLSLLSLGTGLAAAASSGCTNPVRDQAIEALGPEPSGGRPGPDHRPGQPCLVCHSKGGPSSNKPFAIAGTIFTSREPGAKGAEGITVQFVDARDGKPVSLPQTGPTGNFYVPLQDWPNMTFPIRVGIYENDEQAPTNTMLSLINREGSCNFCHRKNLEGADLTEAQVSASRSSAGQIYVGDGTAKK